VEAELGGDMEGGDVRGGGGHPDGVAVQPHLEVRLRVHRRVLRRLSGGAGGRQEQRDEDEGQRQRHGDADGILLLGHGRRLPAWQAKQTGKTGREYAMGVIDSWLSRWSDLHNAISSVLYGLLARLAQAISYG